MQGIGPHSLSRPMDYEPSSSSSSSSSSSYRVCCWVPGSWGRGLDEGDADGDVGGLSSLGRLVAHQVLHHRVFGHVLH